MIASVAEQKEAVRDAFEVLIGSLVRSPAATVLLLGRLFVEEVRFSGNWLSESSQMFAV